MCKRWNDPRRPGGLAAVRGDRDRVHPGGLGRVHHLDEEVILGLLIGLHDDRALGVLAVESLDVRA